MLEILAIAVILIALANKPKRRRRAYNLRAVRVTPELSLSTLAADTALVVTMTGTSDSQYRAISIRGVWSVRLLTAGEGPLTVGYAHGDYTVAEIKEALEATNAISRGDKIANEKSDRLVRIVGTFSGANATLNDGRPIKTRLNWLMPVGEQINLFVFNEDFGALTTGAVVNCSGTMFVKDAS